MGGYSWITPPELILITLLFLGIFGRSNLVVTSSCILLSLKYFNLDHVLLPLLEKRGLETGLVLLMLHILAPIATEKLTGEDLQSVASVKGIIAVAAGALATRLNGDGLALMNTSPEIIFGMTLGTVLGIFFMRGTPCGPVMAAAVTTVLLQAAGFFR
ncbi:MAG TPA: DUF441 domain-containing protein [Bacillota bacterium]|nr:DUF441 domain-containing protein [Bacillota bacterium]